MNHRALMYNWAVTCFFELCCQLPLRRAGYFILDENIFKEKEHHMERSVSFSIPDFSSAVTPSSKHEPSKKPIEKI